jgi:predicted kinase
MLREIQQPQHKSYLQTGVDAVLDATIGSNSSVGKEISRYAPSLLQTAALFTPGRYAFGASMALGAANEARVGDSLEMQLTEFGMGAAKGAATKALFDRVGNSNVMGSGLWSVPAKGVMLGVSGRAIDVGLTPQNWLNAHGQFDAGQGINRTLATSLDPKSLALDVLIFGAAHAGTSGINKLSSGFLDRSQAARNIVMGTTFGVTGGATGELMAQSQRGGPYDWGEIAKRGLYQGIVDGIASAPGSIYGARNVPLAEAKPNGNGSSLKEALADKTTEIKETISDVVDSADDFGRKAGVAAVLSLSALEPTGISRVNTAPVEPTHIVAEHQVNGADTGTIVNYLDHITYIEARSGEAGLGQQGHGGVEQSGHGGVEQPGHVGVEQSAHVGVEQSGHVGVEQPVHVSVEQARQVGAELPPKPLLIEKTAQADIRLTEQSPVAHITDSSGTVTGSGTIEVEGNSTNHLRLSPQEGETLRVILKDGNPNFEIPENTRGKIEFVNLTTTDLPEHLLKTPQGEPRDNVEVLNPLVRVFSAEEIEHIESVRNAQRMLKKSTLLDDANINVDALPLPEQEAARARRDAAEAKLQELTDVSYGQGAKTQGRILHIVVGPPGAGKSSILVDPLAEKTGALIVDSDNIKPLLEGYEKGLGTNAVHADSAEVAKRVLERAFANGDNIVYPQLGRLEDSMRALIERARSEGYKIGYHYADLPPEQAARRVFERSKREPDPETGIRQMVDPHYALVVAGKNPGNVFQKLRGEADWYQHYNTDVPHGTDAVLVDASPRPPWMPEH